MTALKSAARALAGQERSPRDQQGDQNLDQLAKPQVIHSSRCTERGAFMRDIALTKLLGPLLLACSVVGCESRDVVETSAP